ncbi:autotransporter domain-containing protein [Bradyrhizobium sp. WSM1743]|uniref:autotransporter domain-containing protein n=1 Tax=Bradyrhizobium sp. WSM1743 TaxID=318996 RepID=UPI00041EF88A|nr:autotransporter domain-containing protein [Bradyrhizobium sp. WSM1743]
MATRHLRAALLTSSALALAWMLPAVPARAQDATWLASPGSNDYGTGANWDTGTKPTGTAYFSASNITDLSLFGGVTVGGWTFNAGASNYTFDLSSSQLTFTGAGIVINGGGVTINTGNLNLYFRNTSTAGGATINNNGSLVQFFNSSTAGTAAISNNGGVQFSNSSTAGTAAISNNGFLEFFNTSTAGSATITNNYATTFYENSTAGNAAITNTNLILFYGHSTAGSAIITNNGGITFQDYSTAGTATITVNGSVSFQDNSTAGDAAIVNNANALVDFSQTAGLNGDNKISAGSIAGAGLYLLGANELTVGSNNSSTEVSGAISGTGGSLVKIGTGTLTLSGANTYTGGTTINGGNLQLGSASGVGSILGTVNVGALGRFSVVNADTSGITGISNAGITIFQNASSAGSASISNSGTLSFYDDGTAGSATITNNGGLIYFYGTSTAGSAAITNNTHGQLIFNDSSTAANASITGGDYTSVGFYNSSTAGSATININGYAGSLSFHGTSTAGSATITITSTNSALFYDTSTAGSATINNDGQFSFYGSSTAGNAGITNTGTISFNQTSTAGSAGITNNGVLTFSASSTAASATITNNFAMFFSGAGTAGSATINNAYNLFFNGTSTAGNAVITNNGNGLFHSSVGNTSFTDNATAGNAQLINNDPSAVFDFSASSGPNGDHKLSAGSIAGNGTFYLGANELTVGGNNLFTTVSGVIADGGASGGTGGSLVKTGTGMLTLTGTNTYTGGTTFAGGTVSVSTDANLGDLAGSLTFNGGTLQISGTTFNATSRTINWGTSGGTFDIADAANNFTVSQNLSGGALTKSGAGTLTLTGADTFSSVTISAGTLAFYNTTAGSTTITNNAQLAFYGHSTAGDATIVNSGNVLFDGNSTPGSAQLTNTASTAVINFWTPGPSSDGKLTAGSIAGNGRFDLNGVELTVGSNNLSTTVTGVLTGDGQLTGTSLIKVGSGTLTLSGVNTYTGATSVDGGTLAVNGSIASSSSLTVNSGGTLGGTGTVGNTTIASGGTLAPGNSVGTLTVSGNLAFSAGSFYGVEVSATAADRTNVSGTATLTGATVQALAIPGSFRSQTYTILNASGGFGGTQFAGLSVSGSFSPTRNPHLTYDLNNVYLVLDPGAIVLPAGTGANQSNVAGAINGAVASGGTPPAGFDALLNMGQPQLNRGLSQVSGQPGAAGTQAAFGAAQQFVNMLDPFGGGSDGERGGTAGDGGTLGYASTTPNDAKVREAYAAVTPREASGDVVDRRWGVWASAYGGASTLNGNTAAGSSTTTSRIYGTVVGADYRVSPNTLLGFALGGAGYNFALSDSLGSGRADLFQAGLYARHNFGPAYLSAALAYGWQDVTTDRTVTVSGTDKLTANFTASTFSGRLEAGWRFAPIPASTFGVTPYAAAQVTTFHLPGYGETAIVGSNQFALSYTAQDTTNVRTELGARTDQRILVNDGVLTLRGRLAWAHDSNTNRLVSAAFQTLPGAAFTVNGAQPAADSALVGGRAEMRWRNGLSLAGTVEGEFSRSTQTYTGKGTVRYEW